MVDRDGPGAAFVDFNAADLEEYRAKKVAVDAEPDFERTNADMQSNLGNTQDNSPVPPPPSTNWRSPSNNDLPAISEENKKFLEGLEGKETGLSDEELAILNSAAGLGSEPASG